MPTPYSPNVWTRGNSNAESTSLERLRARPYSAEQWLFLRRLESLAAKRTQNDGRLHRDDWRVRLLDKALYSTYQDCVELNLITEAREIIQQIRGAK